MKTISKIEDKWIDSEIISPPRNVDIDVCYYGVYTEYNNKYYYDSSYRLVINLNNQIYRSIGVDTIFKWKPFQKLETNG